jgi:hypothetical protein
MAITTLSATSGALGVALGAAWTPPDTTTYNAGDQPPLPPGTVVTATDGSEWVAITLGTGGVTETGYAIVYDETFVGVMLTTSNDAYGDQVGIPACGAASEDDVIWVQRSGVCAAIQVTASASANAALFATGTGGQLNSGGSASPFVSGVVLTTARGGTDGTAPGVLNYPQVSIYATPA